MIHTNLKYKNLKNDHLSLSLKKLFTFVQRIKKKKQKFIWKYHNKKNNIIWKNQIFQTILMFYIFEK